tara:strand:+ start:2176 stop:2643 length:468 start_codon:yes stop_codon:yes gene_type:complete
MKNIQTWLDQYGESHTNKTNKLIHWICVPSIFFSILALLSLIEIPILQKWLTIEISNLATIFIFLGLLFYLRLSFTMFIGVTLFTVLCYKGILILDQLGYKFEIALGIFIIAWIGQFIGHKIEGKNPSFFEDLKFLLIGPAWLISFIYQKLGIKY